MCVCVCVCVCACVCRLEGDVVEVGPGQARDQVEAEAAHRQAVPAPNSI